MLTSHELLEIRAKVNALCQQRATQPEFKDQQPEWMLKGWAELFNHDVPCADGDIFEIVWGAYHDPNYELTRKEFTTLTNSAAYRAVVQSTIDVKSDDPESKELLLISDSQISDTAAIAYAFGDVCTISISYRLVTTCGNFIYTEFWFLKEYESLDDTWDGVSADQPSMVFFTIRREHPDQLEMFRVDLDNSCGIVTWDNQHDASLFYCVAHTPLFDDIAHFTMFDVTDPSNKVVDGVYRILEGFVTTAKKNRVNRFLARISPKLVPHYGQVRFLNLCDPMVRNEYAKKTPAFVEPMDAAEDWSCYWRV